MSDKHQPYRRNDGFWSCSVCRWKFNTRPNKDNCPRVLRIERANDEYKTMKQWRKLGFEVVVPDGKVEAPIDAVSIVHSTDWHAYYHRDHVAQRTMSEYQPRSYKSVSSARRAGRRMCMQRHTLIFRVVTLDKIYLVVGGEITQFEAWLEKYSIPINWDTESHVTFVHDALKNQEENIR